MFLLYTATKCVLDVSLDSLAYTLLALKKNGMESKIFAFHQLSFLSLFLFSKNIFYYMPIFSVSILFTGPKLKGMSLGPRLEMHVLLETRQVMKMNHLG